MSFPTPAEWLSHAAHARQMADEYRASGDERKADQRDADAEFYEGRAAIEEWRLAQINEHQEAA